MHFKFQFLRIPSMSIAHHFYTHFSPVQFLIPSFPLKFMIYYNYFTHTYHTHRHTHILQIVAQMYMCLGMAIWVWIIYQNVHVWRKLTTHPSIAHSSFFSPTVLVEVRLCEISPTHFGLTTGIVIMKIS